MFLHITFLNTSNSVLKSYGLLTVLLGIKITPFWKCNTYFRLEYDGEEADPDPCGLE